MNSTNSLSSSVTRISFTNWDILLSRISIEFSICSVKGMNIKKDDIETFDKYDQVFHLYIARLSGNKELESLITKMWDNSLTLRIIAV